MKVKQITLDDDGENLESINVIMTTRELHLIAAMIGPTSHTQRDELSPGGGETGSGIYDALSSVANMFYEDGFHDMIKTL